jgi:hypothetical protein
MMTKLYIGYGALILSLLATSEFRGWSLMPVNQLKDVPKSIRDNPGAYRSHYAFYHHYSGGK